MKNTSRTETTRNGILSSIALAGKLRQKIHGEVRFDDGSRALYATDSSNYRQTPIGVVIPRDEEDVIETIALCREFGAPITCRGAATSLAGQCCNVAVILDFSKYMNRVLELDPIKNWPAFNPELFSMNSAMPPRNSNSRLAPILHRTPGVRSAE